METIDDYELIDKDFKEWWRQGLIAFGMDPSIADSWEEKKEEAA
ncbi:hypothetical protein [Paenibacillus rhizophilus]|nr:hypothetical protein [Paenibacillus rhizophilus]